MNVDRPSISECRETIHRRPAVNEGDLVVAAFTLLEGLRFGETATVDDGLALLEHPGVIAEVGARILYVLTGRDGLGWGIGDKRGLSFCVDKSDWLAYLNSQQPPCRTLIAPGSIRLNPYEPLQRCEAAGKQQPHRSLVDHLGFLVAAVPAVFLTATSVTVMVWTAYLAVTLGQLPKPAGDLRDFLAWGFIYACGAQLPIYIVWAFYSRELTIGHSLSWALMLYFLNALTIPFFLFTKWTGTTDRYFRPASTKSD
jgi:hypothetical protein